MSVGTRIAAVASVAALSVPGAAVAAGELGLSNDGVTWSSRLTTPLFDPDFRWVPGDREESSFFVRNLSADGAVLDIVVVGAAADSLLESGDLAIDVRAGQGPWVGTSATGDQPFVTSMRVPPGQSIQVAVAVTFDAASMNQSQSRTIDLRFHVRLSQAVADGDGRDDDDDDSDDDDFGDGGLLADTGGPSRWLLPLGVGLVSAGIAVRLGQRKEAGDV
jgi:hypothetical protein